MPNDIHASVVRIRILPVTTVIFIYNFIFYANLNIDIFLNVESGIYIMQNSMVRGGGLQAGEIK